MDEELQELRVRVQQLEAERSRLQQERDSALASSNRQDDVQAGPSTSGTPTNRGADRIIYLPRERKCPIFRGTHGVGVEDWIEEVRTSMRVRHVGPTDQAAFIFDHLEGEARDEIKYRSSSEREDPETVFTILKELYGCQQSYVSLQEDFFSRRPAMIGHSRHLRRTLMRMMWRLDLGWCSERLAVMQPCHWYKNHQISLQFGRLLKCHSLHKPLKAVGLGLEDQLVKLLENTPIPIVSQYLQGMKIVGLLLL
ncbi:uncharacterized protein LOC119789420 [Cyprinodon tularosa]|uniref:uncharacterized protein LOC119789420 n=1 Tax=Cyprinodon tularosa TaxID=77115 RepID=UPI0018E26162|nr:uncharacterized protein LOC119789420 [Cyprinodon tularosa]